MAVLDSIDAILRIGITSISRFDRFYFTNCNYNSGWHSGQGSVIPHISEEIVLIQHILRHSERLLAQNFEADLTVIVIWPGESYLVFFCVRRFRNRF